MLFLFLACHSDSDPIKEIDSDTVTYYNDIQPIMERNCLRCHLGNGPGVGDFSDPEQVKIIFFQSYIKERYNF